MFYYKSIIIYLDRLRQKNKWRAPRADGHCLSNRVPREKPTANNIIIIRVVIPVCMYRIYRLTW